MRGRSVAALGWSAILCGSMAARGQESGSTGTGPAVTRLPQQVISAPEGWAGRKTVDQESRITGPLAAPQASYSFTMTLGGFVRNCPSAAGKVPGRDFEYTLIADEIETVDGDTRQTRFVKRVTASLEGQVRDDATLEYVDGTVDYRSERTGAAAESRRVPVHFRPGQYGQPDMATLEQAVRVTGDVAIAALLWSAAQAFQDAQREWMTKDKCVEFKFDPESETVMLGPNESKAVRVELRSKQDGGVVARATVEANALNGIGRLAPRTDASLMEMPVPLTYTASDDPRSGHGFGIAALSRAGLAGDAKWKILDRGRYEGAFAYVDSGTGFTGTGPGASETKVTGRMVWTPEEMDLPSTFGETPSSFFRLSAGELTVKVSFNNQGAGGSYCRGNGERTFAIDSLPPSALQYMMLEIAEDGRYKLTLAIPDTPDPFPRWEFESDCVFPNARRKQREEVRNVSIAVGLQEGTVDAEQGVVGQLAAPIRRGPRTITASWSFAKTGGAPHAQTP